MVNVGRTDARPWPGARDGTVRTPPWRPPRRPTRRPRDHPLPEGVAPVRDEGGDDVLEHPAPSGADVDRGLHARAKRNDGPVDLEGGTGERDAGEVARGELVRGSVRGPRPALAHRVERNAFDHPFGGPVAGERKGVDLDDRGLPRLDEPHVPVADPGADLEPAPGRDHRHQPVAPLNEAAFGKLPDVLHLPVHGRGDTVPEEAPPRLHEIFVELGDPELHVHEIALPRGLVLEAEKAPGGQPTGDFLLFAPRLDRERFRAALHLDAPGELAQVVVTRGVRAGGEPREPVHSLPHDREQPIDLTALGFDGGEPQAPRLDLPVRLRDRGREPPSFDVGEASVPRPSAVLRPPRRVGRPALGASPVPVSLPGPHRPFLPGAAGGGSGREEAEAGARCGGPREGQLRFAGPRRSRSCRRARPADCPS